MAGVALILNPTSRRAGQAERSVRAACHRAEQGEPLVLPTTVEQPGEAQVAAALEAGVSRIVVAGGDGTARRVAGALAASAADVPLGIVPVGTANLFARTARVPRSDLMVAARNAVSGQVAPVDLGWARLTSADGQVSEHPFLVLAGVGYDADTVSLVDPAAKARWGWLAYFQPGVRRLREPRREVVVALDDGSESVELVWSVLAVNSARLPAGATLVPGARLDDGLLHVVVVAPQALREWGRIAGTGLTGRHREHPALRYRSATTIHLASPVAVPVQIDGDVVADVVSARFRLRPSALQVAVGP